MTEEEREIKILEKQDMEQRMELSESGTILNDPEMTIRFGGEVPADYLEIFRDHIVALAEELGVVLSITSDDMAQEEV